MQKDVLGLKVINCRTREVISAPANCSYAALSYVWSTTMRRNEQQLRTTLPCHTLSLALPKTINDATMVVIRPGLQYLWVDKFCIPQTDEIEKARQIGQMDLVFGAAEVTVIAAACDESFGLPGVGATPRRIQPSAQVGDIEVLTSLPWPRFVIEASKWDGRGWTFQEALLSRRCLFLTEDQAYFECAGMTRFESVKVNDDLVVTRGDSDLIAALHGRIYDRRQVSQEYYNLVRVYTGRELTLDSDSFNVFAGIAGHMSIGEYPIMQLSGLPFPKATSCSTAELKRQLLSSFLWSHTAYASGPHAVRPFKRRPGFPSWSWTGWAGEVGCNKTYWKHWKHPIVNITFDYDLHNSLELDSLYDDSFLGQMKAFGPQYLHLESCVVPPESIEMDRSRCHVYGATGSLQMSEPYNPSPQPDILHRFRTRKWEMLFIATNIAKGIVFMVIEDTGDFAIRVGLFSIHDRDCSALFDKLMKTARRKVTLG